MPELLRPPFDGYATAAVAEMPAFGERAIARTSGREREGEEKGGKLHETEARVSGAASHAVRKCCDRRFPHSRLWADGQCECPVYVYAVTGQQRPDSVGWLDDVVVKRPSPALKGPSVVQKVSPRPLFFLLPSPSFLAVVALFPLRSPLSSCRNAHAGGAGTARLPGRAAAITQIS